MSIWLIIALMGILVFVLKILIAFLRKTDKKMQKEFRNNVPMRMNRKPAMKAEEKQVEKINENIIKSEISKENIVEERKIKEEQKTEIKKDLKDEENIADKEKIG